MLGKRWRYKKTTRTPVLRLSGHPPFSHEDWVQYHVNTSNAEWKQVAHNKKERKELEMG